MTDWIRKLQKASLLIVAQEIIKNIYPDIIDDLLNHPQEIKNKEVSRIVTEIFAVVAIDGREILDFAKNQNLQSVNDIQILFNLPEVQEILQQLPNIIEAKVEGAKQLLNVKLHNHPQKMTDSFMEFLVEPKKSELNATIAQMEVPDGLPEVYEDEDELPPPPDEIKKQLGRYNILSEIGRGGMGVVYKAHDPELKRHVALKVLMTEDGDSKSIERFFQEAHTTAKLRHPNIVAVHDIGKEDQHSFLVMDLIKGTSLKEYLKNTSLSTLQIVELLKKIGKAIHFAHKEGIIHRDLKPSNIMIDDSGEPKVMDFGLAKLTKVYNKLSKSGMIIGTLQYMPPEQAEGRLNAIDERSDVYTLGGILYELLTSKPPFTGDSSMNLIYKILEKTPVPPSKIRRRTPRELEIICLKALAKEKDHRYHSVEAFTNDLDRYLKKEPILAKPPSFFYRSNKWLIRHKTLVSVVLGSLVTILSLFYYLNYLASGIVIITTSKNLDAQFMIDQRLANPVIKEGQEKHYSFSLPKGIYQFKMEAKGHRATEFIVDLAPNSKVELYKKLKVEVNIDAPNTEVDAIFTRQDKKLFHLTLPTAENYPIDPGHYTVHLTKQNYFKEIQDIEISAQNKFLYAKKLHPMALWQWEVFNQPKLKDIMVADTNNDGKLELIVVSKQGNIVAYNLQNREQLWTINNNMAERPCKLSLRDLNRDGYLDIILAHKQEFKVFDGRTRRKLFDVVFWGDAFIVADANNDGYPDIVLFRDGPRPQIECYSIRDKGKSLWKIGLSKIAYKSSCAPALIDNQSLIHSKGRKKETGKSMEYHLYRLFLDSGMIEDFYSYEGGKAIYIKAFPKYARNKTHLFWYTDDGHFFCMKVDSKRILWHKRYPPSNKTTIEIIDIDNDGKREVLIYLNELKCLDLETGKEVTSFNPEKYLKSSRKAVNKAKSFLISTNSKSTKYQKAISTSISVADFYHDSQKEIIIAPQKVLYILDGKKLINKENPIINQFHCDGKVQKTILADINYDGLYEILVATDRFVYCIRHRPRTEHKASPQNIPYNFIAHDLTKDSPKEILLGSKQRKIYCLDGNSWQTLWIYDLSEFLARDPRVTIAAGDINGKKGAEVVAHIGKYVIAINDQGKAIWQNHFNFLTSSTFSPSLVDLEGDGIKEIIITSPNGIIYCLNGQTGQLRWQNNKLFRILSSPRFYDVNQDGVSDILIHPGIFFRNLGGGGLYCLNGQNGRKLWKTKTPRHTEGGQLVLQDVTGDGFPEVFVPQVSGFLSCLSSKTGQPRWHRWLRGGDIKYSPLVKDFDRDGFFEVVIATNNDDVHCLDARTGQPKWHHIMVKNWGTVWDISTSREDLQVVDLQMDFDGDLVEDIVATSSEHSFYIISGKNGRWLGSTSEFGYISRIYATDMDGNGHKDMLFIDENRHLTGIYHVEKYFQRLCSTADILLAADSQDSEFLWLAHFNRLLLNQAYLRLLKDLKQYQNKIKWNRYMLDFYRGVCLLAVGRHADALDLFNKCNTFPSEVVDSKFLTAALFIHKGRLHQAEKLLKPLFPDFIFDLERCNRYYSHLFPVATQKKLREFLLYISHKTECHSILTKAYETSFLQKPKSKHHLLELSLKYDFSRTIAHKKRRQNYIEQIFALVNRYRKNMYRFHESFDIIDHALQVIPNSWELIYLRGILYIDRAPHKALVDFTTCMDLEPKEDTPYIAQISVYIILQQKTRAINALKQFKKRFSLQGDTRNIYRLLNQWLAGNITGARQKLRAIAIFAEVNSLGREKKEILRVIKEKLKH